MMPSDMSPSHAGGRLPYADPAPSYACQTSKVRERRSHSRHDDTKASPWSMRGASITSCRVAERVAAFSRSCSSQRCLAPSVMRARLRLSAAACCRRRALSCMCHAFMSSQTQPGGTHLHTLPWAACKQSADQRLTCQHSLAHFHAFRAGVAVESICCSIVAPCALSFGKYSTCGQVAVVMH